MNETVVFNLLGRARIQKLQGRDHLVVNAVVMTEGVHEGDKGPFLYLGEKIENSIKRWDHMPVVIYHPKTNQTARHPEVLDKQGCGLVLNSRMDKKTKMHRVEVWFDMKRTQEVDESLKTNVLADVKNGKMIPCSTGLKISYIDNPGTWKTGQSYKGIADDFEPDHLAILPGFQEGACNKAFINVANASNEFKDKLIAKLGVTGDWKGFVDTVQNDCIIFNHNGEFNRIEYTLDQEGKIQLEGEPEKIIKEVTYKVANSSPEISDKPDPEPIKKESTMDRKAKVTQLIQNSNGHWTEEDRAELEKMGEKQFEKVFNHKPAPAPTPTPTPEPENKPAPTPGNQNIDVQNLLKTLTPEQRMALVPEPMKRFFENKQKEEQVEKDQLIKVLVGNASCPFDESYLKSRTLDELKGFAQMCPAAADEVPVSEQETPHSIFKVAFGAPVHNAKGGKGGDVPVLCPPDLPEEYHRQVADVSDNKVKA